MADSTQDFQVVSLTTPSAQNWITAPQADTTMTVNGSRLLFGSRSAGFEFLGGTASRTDPLLRLDLAYLLRLPQLVVTRHIAVTDGSPTFEEWTTFEALGSTVTLSDLNAWQMTVAPGPIRWINGLRGDAADVVQDSAFNLRRRDLAVGSQLTLGATERSSAEAVPWFAVEGGSEALYGGLMWSGSWSLVATRTASALSMTFGLAAMSTSVGRQPVDGPHALIGVVPGGLHEASSSLTSYILQGIRGGRAYTPLVTYNTWFAYGTGIDEDSMRAEMAGAAALGAELFVIDAGWYAGAGANGPFDFDSGLGSYAADPQRFPNGLRALTDYAHRLGLKFGIWVEPERVNLSMVGASGLQEPWLATVGGQYGSTDSAQICLSGAGRQWVFDQLTAFLDDVQPDYLKWDNNMFLNCDRAGHGHSATDGNFAHVNGLYALLEALKARYPEMLIENVSGGGNRLDFGMLRYTDVAWMDDRSAPAVHVRHNLEGLSAAFPPAYLLSFVTYDGEEPLHDAPDLALYVRSRMSGVLGLCFRTDLLSVDDVVGMAQELAVYKRVRLILSTASGALLSRQARVTDGPPWDVLQVMAADGSATVFAYQGDPSGGSVTVKPVGLQPEATYTVTSVDSGWLGSVQGAALMADGIEVVPSPETAAHILTVLLDAAAP